MRLVDAVFRQGHLSDQALIEAILTGDRPVHLERCDLCAERAMASSRWLDEVRLVGLEAADQVFTPERLTAQHGQIMRRLEQLDEPSRVLAFPGQTHAPRESSGRRVAPAWVGVAAAAGLLFGLVGGQITARMSISSQPTVERATPSPTVAQQQPPSTPEPSPTVLDLDYENMGVPPTLTSVDELTPVMVPRSAVNIRSGGS